MRNGKRVKVKPHTRLITVSSQYAAQQPRTQSKPQKAKPVTKQMDFANSPKWATKYNERSVSVSQYATGSTYVTYTRQRMLQALRYAEDSKREGDMASARNNLSFARMIRHVLNGGDYYDSGTY